MHPIGDNPGPGNFAYQQSVPRARAVQKVNGTGGFNGEWDRGYRGGRSPPPLQLALEPPRSGTEESVSFRYADASPQRLIAPFVAQLLGQLMPGGETSLSQARAAYRAVQGRTNLLLDKNL